MTDDLNWNPPDLAPAGWEPVHLHRDTDVARWAHTDSGVMVALRYDDPEGEEAWFTAFYETPEFETIREYGGSPYQNDGIKVAVGAMEDFDEGVPESVERGRERVEEGTSGTGAGEDWPGLDNPRRMEAFRDMMDYADTFGPEHFLDSAFADSFREAYTPMGQGTYGTIQSAVDHFGIEFVVDAAFAVAETTRSTPSTKEIKIAGQTAREWKERGGSERPDKPTVLVYPEEELPEEVNGWVLVGTRPGRVVYKSGEVVDTPHRDDAVRYLYLEATSVEPDGSRASKTKNFPWGIRREFKTSDWTRASNPSYPVSLLGSFDEAVDRLLDYMERWPPGPIRNPATNEFDTQLQQTLVLHAALADLLDTGEFATVDALIEHIDEFREAHRERAGQRVTPTAEQVAGEERLVKGTQQEVVYSFLDLLYPDILAVAKDLAERDDLPRFPFQESRGEWESSLQPDVREEQSGFESFTRGEGGEAEPDQPREQRARSGAEREDPERGQRTLGSASERGLDEFGAGGESASERHQRRKERRREREKRAAEQRERAGGQFGLGGERASEREASKKEAEARRAERKRPERGLADWVQQDQEDVGPGADVEEGTFGEEPDQTRGRVRRDEDTDRGMRLVIDEEPTDPDRQWSDRQAFAKTEWLLQGAGRDLSAYPDQAVISRWWTTPSLPSNVEVELVEDEDTTREPADAGWVPESSPETPPADYSAPPEELNGWILDPVNSHDHVYHRSGDSPHDAIAVDKAGRKFYVRTLKLTRIRQATLTGQEWSESAHTTLRFSPSGDGDAALNRAFEYMVRVDGDGSYDPDGDFDAGEGNGNGGGSGPGERPGDHREREWFGTQKRSVADADYYALHFEGRVSTSATNQLLNRFQSAERVINWAQTKPSRLLAMQGIGQRTVTKLAELDPAEAIKSPEERGTRKDTLRKHDKGPEGGGLSRFEDVPAEELAELREERRAVEQREAEREDRIVREAATNGWEYDYHSETRAQWVPDEDHVGPALVAKYDENRDVWHFERGKGPVLGWKDSLEAMVSAAEQYMAANEPDRFTIEETVVLVGCGAEKLAEPAPAKDLYTSNYFSLKRRYAEVFGDRWFVLSAEHGLVHPDEEIVPYNTTMSDLSSSAVESWKRRVTRQLVDVPDIGHKDAQIVVLAGRDYVEPLRTPIKNLAAEAVFPFDETSGIGEQMGWLNEQLEAVGPVPEESRGIEETSAGTKALTDVATGAVDEDEPRPWDEDSVDGQYRHLALSLNNASEFYNVSVGALMGLAEEYVGPRSADGPQGTVSVDDLKAAIRRDPSRIESVDGIGGDTARRVREWAGVDEDEGGAPPPAAVAEALQAVDPDTAAFYRDQESTLEAALRVAGFGELSHPDDEESYLGRVLMLLDDQTRERWERIQQQVQEEGEPTGRKLGDYEQAEGGQQSLGGGSANAAKEGPNYDLEYAKAVLDTEMREVEGIPRLVNGWEQVDSPLQSATPFPDREVAWQSPATETREGNDAAVRVKVLPRGPYAENWWWQSYLRPYSAQDRGYHDVDSAGPFDTAEEAVAAAVEWMEANPAEDLAREEGGAAGAALDPWEAAVGYLREHYEDTYQSRGEFTADLSRFASEQDRDLPGEAGHEGVTQPLLRYQDIPPGDVARQIENKVGEKAAEVIQDLIIAFAEARASRYDDPEPDGGTTATRMGSQSRSRWQRIQQSAREAVEELGVGPGSLVPEDERKERER